MDAFYRGGELKRVVATQHPVLRQQVPEGERTVESERMEAVFKEGGVLSVAAVGGVHWTMNSEMMRRDGESERLDLGFLGQQLQDARGQGQVVYREERPSGRLTLTANNAAYDPGPNLFSFSDPEGAHLYYSKNSMEGAVSWSRALGRTVFEWTPTGESCLRPGESRPSSVVPEKNRS